LVLFGSATPDVATYFCAKQEGRIVALPKRIFNQALPKTEIVDMREEFVHGNRSIFSTKLLGALAECLRRGEQAILLMNRRGFAAHVFCRACGFVVTCKNCSVSLVYHQHTLANKKKFETSQPPSGGSPYRNSKAAEGYLACHHCGFTCGNLSICPSCASPFIKQYGLGTQRVEQELGTYFPDAKVLRLDSDTATKKGAHETILGSFAEGKADILIGTQMVAKGLDIERVTLVGVLAADASFNMPDYRSLERGFQLLTQVAGRAGRGQHAGEVILQTYNAEMPVLAWARAHDYQDFYEAEIEARQSFEYPPFSQLLRVVVAAEDATQATRECELIAEQLGGFLADLLPISEIEILGPAPCLLERLRNKFREHLLIKNKAGEKGQALISQFFRQRKQPEGVVVAIDVDALDLL
jgi:primosomal protein N' (replication factor Y)